MRANHTLWSSWFIALLALVGYEARAQDCNDWRPRSQVGPPARERAGMAFDKNRGVAVMFGGSSGTASLGDTWEWDGASWIEVLAAGPSPRSALSMVYDSQRGVIVLFGGWQKFGGFVPIYGDTWEYDGRTWSLRSISGPSPRHTFSMAYDARNHCTVLFGGVSAGFVGDTWTWDGATWTLRSTVGPSARSCHAMTYDEVRERVVLFGGSSGDYLRDTWEWNGSSWTLVTNSGPVKRCAANVTYDSIREVVVLFGGGQIEPLPFLNDTWTWNGKVWVRVDEPGPSLRAGHSMTFDESRARTILFGGFYDWQSPLGDTWELQMEGPVYGDLTDDCVVDENDILEVVRAWGRCVPKCSPKCIADIAPTPDGDCQVNVADLLAVITNWG